MSPLVSCVVPVFNGEAYLEEAIDSILAQHHARLEIILVDDGSTDGTADVVAKYGDRVRYHKQANAGPPAARNQGVKLSEGEFVAFLDADDLWQAEKLSRQLQRFEERPELGACVTHMQNFFIPALKEEAERFQGHRVLDPAPGYLTQSLLAKRTVFDAVGRFDEGLLHGDSTDWFLRAIEQGIVIELLPDVLVCRRLHHANRTRLLAADSRNEFLAIVKATLDRRRRAPDKSSSP